MHHNIIVKIGEVGVYGVLGFIGVQAGKALEMIEISGMVQAVVYGGLGAGSGLLVKHAFSWVIKKIKKED